MHNPVGEEWGARCPLSVSVSDDDGLTWHRVLDLEDGTEAPATLPASRARAAEEVGPPSGFAAGDTGIVTDGRGEYSYPSATTDGATLLVAYTWQRRGIVLARVPLRLVDRPVADAVTGATDRAGSS